MAEILHFPAVGIPATPAPREQPEPSREQPEPSREQPAPSLEPAPSDAAARAAALDTRRSCIVEAPAGSGKTGLLVQRFLKLLADPDVAQPEEVLAMTFTRKATAEMQQRVLEQLQAAHICTPPHNDASPFDSETRALAAAVLARDAQLGWNLLAQPQRLNIRSILSVCLEIANSLPLLSGSGDSRDPLEDAGPLYRLAARRTLLQLGGPDRPLHDALRTLLLHRDGSLADCESLIASMLATRDQWGELVPLGPSSLEGAAPDDATLDPHPKILDSHRKIIDPYREMLDRQIRPKLERTLEAIVCAGLSRALHAMPQPLLQELAAFAARHAHLPGYSGPDSPIALCAGKHQPPDAIAAHLDHWVALIRLLVKPSDGGWRKSFAHNLIGFKPPQAELDRLKRLVAEIQAEPLREALCAVVALPPAKYPDEQWAVARALFQVLRRALVELKLLFADRAQCDYVELALAAREALSEPTESAAGSPADSAHSALDSAHSVLDSVHSAPDLALSAGGRLRHLLVDEMQDTSSAQYDLIKLLTASWDGHSQTLFLVGDPKQSIYLFRQARVERFLRTMQDRRLGEIALTPLRLSANFRSQAALVYAFNEAFGGSKTTGRIFPPPSPAPGDNPVRGGSTGLSTGTDVPFVAATPIRPQTIPEAIVWHTAVLGEEDFDASMKLTGIPAADHNAQEALTIRRLIEQRLAMPLPEGRNDPLHPKPWRIAVLARARNHLSAIVQELKAHDGRPAIPFRAIDLDPLDELPEVLDALALTRALLHPADRIAWLAVLHAPWCGLGLADLLHLTGEGSGCDPNATVAALVRTRRRLLSPLGQSLLDRAWPILEAAAATLGRTPLSIHVERTWRSLGGDAPLAAERRSNVLRFLRVLREVESDSSLDLLSALNARLHNLFADPLAGPAIQVDLLTIHKAKGLEWDLVLVPGLHRRPRAHSSVLLNWLELDELSRAPSGDASNGEEEASILLAPIWGRGADSDKLNDWLKDVRVRRERAEEKRLFYVASTRAREQLHLFAATTRTAGNSLALPVNGSLLKACWPAAEAHFAAFAARPQELPAREPGAPFIAQAGLELPGGPFIAQLHRAVGGVSDDLITFPTTPPFELDIAAAAGGPESPAGALTPPTLQRLPLGFDPGMRFQQAAEHRLAYIPAAALSRSLAFERPEGGFAVRAFGNVVHRYLQAIAARLAANAIATGALLAELPSWEARLTASLRGEGLPPAVAGREAVRALRALTQTLQDPTGRWILAPHASAASEQSLTLASLHSLRIDRTFLAGPTPLSTGDGCIWIVDFKTTDPGARPADSFAASEIAKYTPQLEAYANLRRSLPGGDRPIHLGLFYPLVPRLLHWPSASNST